MSEIDPITHIIVAIIPEQLAGLPHFSSDMGRKFGIRMDAIVQQHKASGRESLLVAFLHATHCNTKTHLLYNIIDPFTGGFFEAIYPGKFYPA